MKNNNIDSVSTSTPEFDTLTSYFLTPTEVFGRNKLSYPKLIEFVLFGIHIVTILIISVITLLPLLIIGILSKLTFNTILFFLNQITGRKTTVKSINTDLKLNERIKAYQEKLDKMKAEKEAKENSHSDAF